MEADRGNDDRGNGDADGLRRAGEGARNGPRDGAPEVFRAALDEFRSVRLRQEVRLAEVSPPKGLAPFAAAFTAEVLPVGSGGDPEDDELADGRLILLHDPAGHDAWQGTFRLVTLVRAELEPEMAADPLLAEVGWSWLLEALAAHGASYVEPSGTVSRCSSQSFGGIAGRLPVTEVEIRASWTPTDTSVAPGTSPLDGPGGRFAAHLEAWVELLCQAGGLPPEQPGVTTIPPRHGPE